MSNRRRPEHRDAHGAPIRTRQEILVAAATVTGVLALTVVLLLIFKHDAPSSSVTTPPSSVATDGSTTTTTAASTASTAATSNTTAVTSSATTATSSTTAATASTTKP